MLKKLTQPILGTLLFFGSTQLMMCMVIVAALYPNYSIADNYISDLGMANSPAPLLFNVSIFLFGLLIALAAYRLRKADMLFALFAFLTGMGFFGVGIFPADLPMAHLIFALIGLTAGGVMMITSVKLKLRWFGTLSVLLGIFSLATLGLLLTDMTLGLGIGGMERLAFYSILIWVAGFGGSLINIPKTS
ncbi:MAG: DUF998 domain-containing protein [Patescibacteria group bacterium]